MLYIEFSYNQDLNVLYIEFSYNLDFNVCIFCAVKVKEIGFLNGL